LKSLPETLRSQAGKLADLRRQDADRQRALLAQFDPLLKGGDPARGREVFRGKKVACANCHRVGAEGGHTGPDLTKVGAIRTPRDILESVLLPSSTVAQGYETYLAVTPEGRVLSGVMVRQAADTLVLRDSSGAEVRLRRDGIEELRRQPTSLMPERLERALEREELRDLLAYLQGLK
jgi:putative heme-binding domain-containing protein